MTVCIAEKPSVARDIAEVLGSIIEKKTYDARQFLEELKQMVSEIVTSVLSDNSSRRITIQESVFAQTDEKEKKEPKKRERKSAAPREKKSKNETKEAEKGATATIMTAFSTTASARNETVTVPNGETAVLTGNHLNKSPF